MIRKDRKTEKIDPKASRQALQLLFDPDLAMVIGLSGDGIRSKKKTPTNDAIHDVNDCNLIGGKHFGSSQTCHWNSPQNYSVFPTNTL